MRAPGITRERAPRAIVIHDMRLLDWQAPDLSFEVRCTKGAYIRVLGGGSGGAARHHRAIWSACGASAWRRSRANRSGRSRHWNP